MIFFDVAVVSCTARQPKSTTFSGCPRPKLALPPVWPVSVPAALYPRPSAVVIAAYGMAPLNAPFPTARNLPFQPAAGIQSSILISESVDGLNVAAMRQNARGALIDEGVAAGPPGEKGPAST